LHFLDQGIFYAERYIIQLMWYLRLFIDKILLEKSSSYIWIVFGQSLPTLEKVLQMDVDERVKESTLILFRELKVIGDYSLMEAEVIEFLVRFIQMVTLNEVHISLKNNLENYKKIPLCIQLFKSYLKSVKDKRIIIILFRFFGTLKFWSYHAKKFEFNIKAFSNVEDCSVQLSETMIENYNNLLSYSEDLILAKFSKLNKKKFLNYQQKCYQHKLEDLSITDEEYKRILFRREIDLYIKNDWCKYYQRNSCLKYTFSRGGMIELRQRLSHVQSILKYLTILCFCKSCREDYSNEIIECNSNDTQDDIEKKINDFSYCYLKRSIYTRFCAIYPDVGHEEQLRYIKERFKKCKR
jgi:hypothetical protein